MEYSILSAPSPAWLINAVNRAIKEGWRPQGGVVIEQIGNTISYLQAVVKSESD
jgi:hypothetical protein